MSSELYRELILEHYRHPKNYGELESPDFKAKDSNPLCGDEIEIQVKMGEGRIVKDVKFNGKGCAISKASASLLTELIKGKDIDEIKEMRNEEILRLLGIDTLQLNPARMQCALLPLRVLKTGIRTYIGESAKRCLG